MSEFQNIMMAVNKEQLISNIERIISSYRHPWDIFTELIQNSLDAIIEEHTYINMKAGNIKLEVFPAERKLIISDNGCGIAAQDLSRILFVGESLKRKNKTGKYGFMGYGLTFVAFQTEFFCVESAHKGKYGKRTYKDLYKFIYDENEHPLPESEEEKSLEELEVNTSAANNTKISLIFPKAFRHLARENDLALAFQYAENEKLFSALLRTKSAIGFLDPLFDPSIKTFTFNLYINNNEIKTSTSYLDFQEILQDLYPTEKRFYDIDTEYPVHLKASEKFPKETQLKFCQAFLLYGKYNNIEIGEREPLKARFVIYALSKKHIGKYNSLLYRNHDELLNSNNAVFKIDNGVWLAINGVPTGIRLDSYDHPNFLPFTVVVDLQDDYIKKELDAGRKGISELRKKQIVHKAKELLDQKNFLKYRSYVLETGSAKSNSATFQDGLSSVEKMIKKSEQKTAMLEYKNKFLPPLEEQDVISIFIELVVLEKLKGYTIKMLSSNATYDALLNYEITRNEENFLTDTNFLGISEDIFIDHGKTTISKENLVVEFKYKLSNIFPDLDQKRKKISEIDILVCWDTTNNDDKLEDYGYYITQKDHTDTLYYGVTHDVVGSEGTLKVMELKTVLKNLIGIEFKNPAA